MPVLRRKDAFQAETGTDKSQGKMSEHNHTEEIRKLQLLEQSLHSILMQKQQFQAQLLEVESALSELDKTSSAYKIVGNIMVASKKEDLKKDLETKKEIFSTRMKAMDK